MKISAVFIINLFPSQCTDIKLLWVIKASQHGGPLTGFYLHELDIGERREPTGSDETKPGYWDLQSFSPRINQGEVNECLLSPYILIKRDPPGINISSPSRSPQSGSCWRPWCLFSWCRRSIWPPPSLLSMTFYNSIPCFAIPSVPPRKTCHSVSGTSVSTKSLRRWSHGDTRRRSGSETPTCWIPGKGGTEDGGLVLRNLTKFCPSLDWANERRERVLWVSCNVLGYSYKMQRLGRESGLVGHQDDCQGQLQGQRPPKPHKVPLLLVTISWSPIWCFTYTEHLQRWRLFLVSISERYIMYWVCVQCTLYDDTKYETDPF